MVAQNFRKEMDSRLIFREISVRDPQSDRDELNKISVEGRSDDTPAENSIFAHSETHLDERSSFQQRDDV